MIEINRVPENTKRKRNMENVKVEYNEENLKNYYRLSIYDTESSDLIMKFASTNYMYLIDIAREFCKEKLPDKKVWFYIQIPNQDEVKYIFSPYIKMEDAGSDEICSRLKDTLTETILSTRQPIHINEDGE